MKFDGRNSGTVLLRWSMLCNWDISKDHLKTPLFESRAMGRKHYPLLRAGGEEDVGTGLPTKQTQVDQSKRPDRELLNNPV